jgi:multidrug efflux pump subunit AcrA (membrane-fusion protein)
MHKILAFIKSHTVLASAIVIVAVAVTAIAGRMASSSKVTDTTGSNTKQVTLVDVRTFRTGLSTVSADGIVESISQVDLKSQLSAPLATVNTAIGSFVSAGQVIAELQNADIRAQLDQARATLTLAQSQYSTSGIGLISARRSAIEAVRSSYAKADDVVNVQVEDMLSKDIGSVTRLSQVIVDPNLRDKVILSHEELQQTILPSWKSRVDTLSESSTESQILDVISISRNNLDRINTLLDNVVTAINIVSNDSPQSLITVFTTWKSTVTNLRSSVTSTVNGLTSAESGLVSAGVSKSSAAEAQISSAQAGVRNLEAQLAKTIIRAPISGRIAALPLRTGELASPGQLIATIVGSGGLQIKAYTSGEDLIRLERGAHATIDGTISGTVATVAPSVNQTNKKVEVNIAVNGISNLVVGQTVPVLIEAKTIVTPIGNATYLLPMQNVKIVPGEAYVLTVDADSKIVKNPVTLGEVRGEFVEVKSGLTDDMQIVSPVYELNPGETVKIQ